MIGTDLVLRVVAAPRDITHQVWAMSCKWRCHFQFDRYTSSPEAIGCELHVGIVLAVVILIEDDHRLSPRTRGRENAVGLPGLVGIAKPRGDIQKNLSCWPLRSAQRLFGRQG